MGEDDTFARDIRPWSGEATRFLHDSAEVRVTVEELDEPFVGNVAEEQDDRIMLDRHEGPDHRTGRRCFTRGLTDREV